MLTKATSPALRRLRGRSRALVSLCLTALAVGCSGLLDVENPNNVNIDNLNNPAAAGPLANGALSATARAWGTVLTPYSEATDELTWIGSRDAWGDLDQGYLSGITNEFVDAAFPSLAQARWLGDEAIKKDRKQIEGTWRVVALEVNGNKAMAEDAKNFTVVNGADGTWGSCCGAGERGAPGPRAPSTPL